jgi:hypothetical protein
MANRRTTNTFAEVDSDDIQVYDEVEVVSPTTVVQADLVSCRVKGSWTMYWGRTVYKFVDGTRYKLPKDLYAYLRNSGNIYDTL